MKQLVEIVCDILNIKIIWRGEYLLEEGVNKMNNKTIIKIDPKYYRPSEVGYLKGDATRARRFLGWEPEISFEQLLKEMIYKELLNE